MADSKSKTVTPPLELAAGCEVSGILYAVCQDVGKGTLYAAGTDWSVYRVENYPAEPSAVQAWTHHDNQVSGLVCHGGIVISGGYDRRLVWTDAESGEVQRRIENAHDGWIRDITITPDGRLLLSVGDDLRLRVRNAETGESLHTLSEHAPESPQGYFNTIYAVAVSPDGRTAATADRIGDVCLWNLETGKLSGRLKAPAFYTWDGRKRSRSIGGIRSVCFSPDGTRLALAGIGAVTNVDGFVGPARVEVWDPKAEERSFVIQDGHKAVLNHVAFHPTRPLLIAAGGGDGGGLLGLWDSGSGTLVHKAKPKGHLQRFLIDEAAGQIVAAGHAGLQFWKLRDQPQEEQQAAGA